MKYHWGGWTLDREAGLLLRHGRPVDVSRRVLDCISHLIAHRERVVSYDELIRKVWGHDNVTNHQLSQVILSARRLLGDDGHAQRLIRTAAGLGYQWVGALDTEPSAAASDPPRTDPAANARGEAAAAAERAPPGDATANDAAAAVAPAPQQEPVAGGADAMVAGATGHAGAPSVAQRSRRLGRPVLAFAALALLVVAGSRWLESGAGSITAEQPKSADSSLPPLQSLEEAMRRGDFDAVRDGLTALPPSRAESPDAMLLAMRLALYRGRFERARDLFDRQMALARAANDPIWQAKLFVFEASLKSRTERTATEQLASTQAALDLLGPLGQEAPPEALADALQRHAAVLLLLGRHDDALRDLARSGALYDQVGDTRSAIGIRNQRARIWMRTGRLEDALRATRGVAQDYQRLSDKIGTLAAYNTMTRIQMELLRLDDALESSDRATALLREIPEIERRKRVQQLRALAFTRLGRLRQARALLEESETLMGDEADSMIAILYLLESGRHDAVLKASAEAFAQSAHDDPDDILLETREGALLVWVTAAERIARTGSAMPSPSPAQIDALRNPRAIAGLIAEARWMMAQDDAGRAEAVLTEALDEARRKGMRYHMVLASESMVDLLLRQGRIADAKRLLQDVRAFDREHLDRDYGFVLQRWRLAVAMGDDEAAQRLSVSLRALAGERRIPDASEVAPGPPKAPEGSNTSARPSAG